MRARPGKRSRLAVARRTLLVVIVAALAGCAAPTAERRLEQARGQLEARSRLVASMDRYEDAALERYVSAVLERLTKDEPEARPKLEILDSSYANAFAKPDEGIRLTRGMIALLDSEAELAFVIAHEIGHLRQGPSAWARLLSSSVAKVEHEEVDRLSQSLMQREVDADQRAVRRMEAAGYDSAAARSALEVMRSAAPPKEPRRDFRSHPSSAERIAALPAAKPGEVGDARHRAAIDGLPLDYHEGPYRLIDGRVQAPFLKLSLPIPSGFVLNEIRGGVLIMEHPRKEMTLIVGSVSDFDDTAEKSLRGAVYESFDENIGLGALRNVEVKTGFDGSDVATGHAPLVNSYPRSEIRIVAARRGEIGMVIALIHAVRDHALARMAMQQIERGAQPLSAETAPRLRFVAYRAGMPLEPLAERFGAGEEGMHAFRRFNRLAPDALPQPGQLLKVLGE